MDAFIAVVPFLFLILTLVHGYFRYSFNYWSSRGILCDSPSFPYGHIRGVGKRYHVYEIVQKMYNKYKPTGAKMCGVYLFSRPAAIILDLELVKNIFIRDFNNFDQRNLYYNEVDDPVGAHLFTLNGDDWKRLRAKLTPSFSSGKMKSMFPIVVEVGERFRDYLLEAATKSMNELEIGDWCARFTTDIIGTCAFGIECNSLKDPNTIFRQYGRRMALNSRHGPLFFALFNGFKTIGRKLHIKTIPDDVSQFVMDIASETINFREKNKVHRNDFMDILIKLKNADDKESALTFNELSAQIFAFFAAGHETTATTLTFCLYELAINPEIQTKARNVIQAAYKKYNGQFTYEMMMDLSYIDQIFEETLRKCGPATFVTREAKNDYRIPGTNVIIEKGLTVIIPIHAIHLNPDYYPNPNQFDPDRFSNEEKNKRNPLTCLSFGAGQRNCIGVRFAVMEAKVALVLLLNSFEFSPGSKTTIPLNINKNSVVFSPKGGVYLQVTPLKK